jgi:hypothetical protein
MSSRNLHFGLAVAAVAAGLSLLMVSLPAAQNGTAGAKASGATIKRFPDGHPDLNGYWSNPQVNTEDGSGPGHLGVRAADGSVLFDFGGPNNAQLKATQRTDQPHYKPEYAAKVKALGDSFYGGSSNQDPMVQCKPLGIPRGGFGTMHIVQNPSFIALLFESPMDDRIIYTDGRPHPKDLETSFMGDSIGHWEGDTLVVDVAGLNDETWYAGGVNSNQIYSTIHSDKEHVVERWTVKPTEIDYQATVTDPVMLVDPWIVNRRVQRAASDDYLLQYNCITNDVGHIVHPTDKDQFRCVYGGTRPECQQ